MFNNIRACGIVLGKVCILLKMKRSNAVVAGRSKRDRLSFQGIIIPQLTDI